MILLHNIGYIPNNSNYNTPNQILMCKEQLSFDGVYQNVWTNRHVLKFRQHKTILFVMGDTVGSDNAFDTAMPLERFCNWDQIMNLVINYNCELGWHTWSHKNLTLLEDDEVLKEITPPFPMKYFAYPYGNVNSRVETIVRSIGCYEDAWSVNQGTGAQFQRNRKYL
jgi:hypothetical protein